MRHMVTLPVTPSEHAVSCVRLGRESKGTFPCELRKANPPLKQQNHNPDPHETISEQCACALLSSQDEPLTLHLLVRSYKTAPLLDWKYRTETLNNLRFCGMKRSQGTEITFCDKCAACLLFIYFCFYTSVLIEAEFLPAVQIV